MCCGYAEPPHSPPPLTQAYLVNYERHVTRCCAIIAYVGHYQVNTQFSMHETMYNKITGYMKSLYMGTLTTQLLYQKERQLSIPDG